MVLPSRYVQSLTSSLHFVLTKPTHFPAICSWWNPIDLRSTPALLNLFSTENPRDTFFKKMKVLSYELLPVIKCTDFKSTNQYILTNGYILPPCRSSHRMFISRPTFPWCPSLVNYLPSRGNESSDFCYQSSVLPVSEDRMNGTHTTYLLCIWISFTRHNIFEMYSYCRVHSIYHFIDEQCPIV